MTGSAGASSTTSRTTPPSWSICGTTRRRARAGPNAWNASRGARWTWSTAARCRRTGRSGRNPAAEPAARSRQPGGVRGRAKAFLKTDPEPEERAAMTMVRIGDAVRRGEDFRLLRGRGRYLDDVAAPGQARAFVLRSPHAHADIRSIDSGAARARISGARRARHPDRGRSRGARARHGSGGAADKARRRLAGLQDAAAAARPGARPHGRPGGRLHRRRDRGCGQGRRRADRRRLRAAARAGDGGRCARPRRPGGLGRQPRQRGLYPRGRRCGGDSGRVREGGSRRAPPGLRQPGDREPDGAARLPRPI